MKTSSKILTGFFIIVFLVPLAMFMSFKSKIKKGQYTLVRNDSFESINSRKGDLGSFKVVKLVGIDGNLKVNLAVSKTPHYNYSVDGSDSIKVFHAADTLIIQSTGMVKQSHTIVIESTGEVKQNQGNYYRNDLYIDLALTSLENIVAEDAEVFINANDSSIVKLVAIDLKANAALNIGQQDDHDPSRRTMPLHIGELKVITDDAKLFIGKNVTVSQLELNAAGSSDVTISNGVTIDKVTGSLSDSSSVNANWRFLKQLQGISQP